MRQADGSPHPLEPYVHAAIQRYTLVQLLGWGGYQSIPAHVATELLLVQAARNEAERELNDEAARRSG